MKNRFNQDIRRGMAVTVAHPRGGSYPGTVAEIQTARHPDADTRRFVRAYGPRVVFTSGGTAALDDCTPGVQGNAGCDRCGVNDRAPGSVNCVHCDAE